MTRLQKRRAARNREAMMDRAFIAAMLLAPIAGVVFAEITWGIL